METKKIEPKFPIESATSRDILAVFFPDHELCSMDGATAGQDHLTFNCSCGQELSVTSERMKAKGWTLVEVKDRLSIKKLGQIGRTR